MAEGQRAAAEPRVKLPLESAQPPALVGFYSVYDDLASEDALASKADGGPTASIFSATMVLRADGQTSRGSEFPGGSWEAAERDGRDAEQAPPVDAIRVSRLIADLSP